jgi:hypothetical protein
MDTTIILETRCHQIAKPCVNDKSHTNIDFANFSWLPLAPKARAREARASLNIKT